MLYNILYVLYLSPAFLILSLTSCLEQVSGPQHQLWIHILSRQGICELLAAPMAMDRRTPLLSGLPQQPCEQSGENRIA